MNKLIAALCACLLLSACVGSSRSQFPEHYALATAAPVIRHGSAQRPARAILQITRLAVPPWLQGTSMFYRLGYRHDARLSAYGQSNWVAPPAQLLEPVLQQAIAAAGGWRAVLGPDNPARADLQLHIRLEDFSQHFSAPSMSTGVIEASATLIDNRDESVIGQKHFYVQVAAAGADAAGGVAALGQASSQLAKQLQRWIENPAVAQHEQPEGQQ